MVPLGSNDFELTADAFWREIRRLEWEASEGLWAEDILAHNNTRTLAGATYAPENEIINGYTILFDGLNPVARKVFLRGDNNNIIDAIVFNGVSVIPSNSAGNTVTEIDTGSGLTEEDRADLKLIKGAVAGRTEILDQSDGTQNIVIYADDGETVLATLNLSLDRNSRTVVE